MLYNFNFVISMIIMMTGLYTMIATGNLMKKLLGMGIFQTSILLLYISLAKIRGASIPFLECMNYNSCPEVYTNPLPQVLMLTAIVVGVATLAVGLSIVIRIKEDFGNIEEEDLYLREEPKKENE